MHFGALCVSRELTKSRNEPQQEGSAIEAYARKMLICCLTRLTPLRWVICYGRLSDEEELRTVVPHFLPATSKHTDTGILTDVIIMKGGKTPLIDRKSKGTTRKVIE